MIGAIGSKTIDDVIIFEVSDEKIFTFNDFSRENSVRFSKHDILLRKPVSEYTGKELDKINFKIKLKASLGVDPRDEMDKLIRLQRDGTVISLVIEGKGFGEYRWVIKSLNMAFETVDNTGFLVDATLSIGLEEYI